MREPHEWRHLRFCDKNHNALATLSIIICSIDDAKFNTVAQMYSRLLPTGSFQIARVSDAKSLAQGYNRGIAATTGDYIILSHDDIEFLSPDFAQRLAEHLAHFDLIGIAGTTRLCHPMWIKAGFPHIFGQVAHPHELGGYMVDIYSATRRTVPKIQALDGLFLAMHRRVAAAIPFDEQTFDGFHCYDVDFSFRAHLAGFRLAVACDIPILHYSKGKFDDAWEPFAQRFLAKHIDRLTPVAPNEFLWGWIRAPDKTALLEVMTPISWEPI